MDNLLRTLEELATLTEVKAELEKCGVKYEELLIKNQFPVIIADVGGHFGLSRFVFNQDEKQLKYCNYYELHLGYLNGDKKAIRERLIEGLNTKIYTESELLEPDSDYTSQETKRYFLHNYYYPNCDYITAFCISGTKDEKELNEKIKNDNLVYDPLQFCYVSDPEKVKAHIDLYKRMEKAFISDSYDYWFKAFKHEMYNHEYAINYQGDWDVINCFTKLTGKYSENREELLSRVNLYRNTKKGIQSRRPCCLQ